MKRVFFLSILLFVKIIGYSQTNNRQNNKSSKLQKPTDSINTAVFTLDLGIPHLHSLNQTSKNRISLNATWRENVSFRLVNANPFKYKYTIAGTTVNLFSSSPSPLDSLIKLNSKQSAVETSTTPSKALDTIAENRIAKHMAFRERVNALFSDTTTNAVKSELRVHFLQDTSKNTLVKNAINLMLVYDQHSQNMLGSLQSFQAQLAAEDYLDANSLITQRDSIKKAINAAVKNVNNLTENLGNLDTTAIPKFDSLRKDFGTNLSAINVIVSKLFSVQLDYYTLPYDVNWKNMDYLAITITRQNAQTSANVDSYDYNIWATGGFKIDVSGGAFITNVKDLNFFTIDSAASGKKFIKTKNEGRYDFGFGSMLNISFRTGAQWIRPGISVGALFTSAQKFQVLAGGSVLIGKEQRVVFHFGLAMGIVTKLENGYIADQEQTAYNLGTNGQVPTASKFTAGRFFGFTYNFTKSSAKTAGTTN